MSQTISKFLWFLMQYCTNNFEDFPWFRKSKIKTNGRNSHAVRFLEENVAVSSKLTSNLSKLEKYPFRTFLCILAKFSKRSVDITLKIFSNDCTCYSIGFLETCLQTSVRKCFKLKMLRRNKNFLYFSTIFPK